VMAWAAARGQVDTPAWLLFSATAAWAVAYDTIYALQDREDDRRIGVKSAALLFGSSTWMAVAMALGVMLLLLGAAGWLSEIGWPYYAVLAGAAVFAAAQSRRLRRPIAPRQAFAMFHAHVWVGVAILFGLLAGFLLV
jgi:4-hydroxybenzoate polyprenyltransferase